MIKNSLKVWKLGFDSPTDYSTEYYTTGSKSISFSSVSAGTLIIEISSVISGTGSYTTTPYLDIDNFSVFYITTTTTTSTVCSIFDKGYRFGFNGKEKDNEINVNGGACDYGSRIYDGRLGRWMSIDLLGQFYSNYVISNNNPVVHVDIDGNWVPSVTANGAIILTAEMGDTYGSFIKFFGSEEIAKKYITENQLKVMKKSPDQVYVEGGFIYFKMDNKFSETLKDSRKIPGEMALGLLDPNLSKQGYFGDSYNCFYMVKMLIVNGTIRNWRAGKRTVAGEVAGPTLYQDDFKLWMKQKKSPTTEANAKFGSTIQTFGNDHAAIFFGKDSKGNSYSFTKNGDKVAPTIMKTSNFNGGNNEYGGDNYGKPREMPASSDESEDHKKTAKGGWYDPL